MGEENAPDPQNVDKDKELIRASQKEIATTDVLVCGGCHEVFHFLESFEKHKEPGICSGNSTLKDSCHGESNKPQIWAFTLWKNAQYKTGKEGSTMPSSWDIYKEWCKLDAKEKDAWILAGKNIQTFSKLSDAKLVEVKVKPQAYGRRSNQKVMVTVPSLSTGNKTNDKDPLEEGEIRLSQLPEAQRKALKAQTEANKVSDDADPLGSASDSDGKSGKENGERKSNSFIKRGLVKPVQLNSDVTILPSNKRQTRSSNTKNEEFGVEKIVSKRYNPRKKTFEYLVKWENSDKNECTWEPTANLESCKDLIDEYEANLKQQRMQKTQAAALQKQYEKKRQKADTSIGDIIEGRPQRSSKQKALNQVKAWCGDISDADEEDSAKRKFEDDSDSDSFEKKIRLEEDSDTDDEIKPTVTVRKITKSGSSSVNGVGKKSSAIGKILIPDSKGIVRINQKQASELSSGVYIMSKTAGIIKLDSNASKFATSGGQAIVKVEPRIGQTQIKVVKKDAGVSSVKLTPKPKITLKSVTKTTTKETKKATTSSGQEKKDTTLFSSFEDEKDEESDDGLPELEFPSADLPLPEPDSPPGDFILDPETGKIAGQEYPEESSVVIAVEKDELKNDVKEETEGGLENLVKLAAADILEDELKENVDEAKKPQEKDTIVPISQSTPLKINQIKESTASSSNSTSSILQRKLLSTPKPQQQQATTIRKVVPGVAPLKRNNTPIISPVRRTVTAKPKQYVPMNTPPIVSKVRQSYTNKNLNVHKKIGQTTIYRTVQKPQQKSTHQIIHPQTILKQQVQQQQRQQKHALIQKKQQETIPAATTTTAVINMPSLAIEDTAAATTSEMKLQIPEETTTAAVSESITDLSALAELNDSETPLIITGEDGTIYQVAGQNEQGQTILISQGADGQSQCLVVATESLQLEDSQAVQMSVEGGSGLHESMVVEQTAPTTAAAAVTAGTETTTDSVGGSEMATEEESMVAQLISADPPSPGGRRNVTVMLPDGSCVTMQVTQEQYESLELDK